MGRHGIALFGFGRAGNIHFKNLIASHRVNLLYIVELEIAKVKDALEEFNQTSVKVVTPESGDLVWEDPEVKGVFICSPTFTHQEIVLKALEHGKAVFCEKPVAETVEGTVACYDEAGRLGLPLLCSFNRRFDPSVLSLRNRVLSGEVGAVHRVKTCSRDHPLPLMHFLKISGGIFHDCAVHDIDMVCWILGEYPTEVYCQAHAHHEEIRAMNDVDTVVIVMKFPSNAIATIDLSRHASYGYDQRVEVFGEDGMIISQNQQPTSLQSYQKSGVSTDPLLFSFPQRYDASYKAALTHFVNVLDGKEEVMVSKLNTKLVSQIADACEKSHRESRPVLMKPVEQV